MAEIEALIGSDWMRGGIRVLWRQRLEDGRALYDNGVSDSLIVGPEDRMRELEIAPLDLSDDKARALLQALIRHYDGGEDTFSLRRDYDAERKRVDRMLDALIVSGKDQRASG